MKKKLMMSIILLLGFFKISYSQEFNKNINKDSLFQVILMDIPEEKRDEFKKSYEESDENSKEFLLFMLAMPRSSKKELIENYELHSVEIAKLDQEYSMLVPDSLIVYIEFNPKNVIINTPESIDLGIYKKNSDGFKTVIMQEWDLEINSEKLIEMLGFLGWDLSTLIEIKSLLDSANCVSIENKENTSIGFARSGMGKYFYVVFDHNLSQTEILEFNDGCAYIYYKKNVVLGYSGGAIGSQCFPD